MITALLLGIVLAAPSDTIGRGLYQAACANCHGIDGTGAPKSHVAFDTPIPDFTDCSFASREPDPDWATVVHGGGPVRGFSRLMPAFRDALSEEQILAVLQYVRTLCTERGWPRGELNMPRPLLTEKAYPEDESVISTTVVKDAVISSFIYERRIGRAAQLEFIVPIGKEKRNGSWTGGVLGDVVIGVKQTLFHSLAHGTIASIAAELAFPTGNSDSGIGTGTYVFESFFSAGRMLTDAAFVQTQAGIELPANPDRAESEGFARAVLGTTFTQGRYGRAWSPMLEFAGSRELEGGAPLELDVAPQLQISLNQRQHLLFSAGLRIPLTSRETRPTSLVFYLLWDWFDGGLRDGW